MVWSRNSFRPRDMEDTRWMVRSMANTVLRKILLIIIDAILINLAVYFSLWLRFEGTIPYEYLYNYQLLMPIYTAITLALLVKFKLYQRLWEYASINEIQVILHAVTASMLLFVVFIYLLQLKGLPRSVYILSWGTTIGFICITRFSWRIFRNAVFRSSQKAESTRVLIVGAGDAGAILARELRMNPRLNRNIIAYVDDDPGKQKMMLNNVPVMGTRSQIPALADKLKIEEIIIAMPSVGGEIIREIVGICSKTKAKVKIVPGIFSGASRNLAGNLRKVQMEDLLRREPVTVDFHEIAGYIKDKDILVTGAGGSIGSELCRQILEQSPAKLILLDNCENNLFDIDMELRTRTISTEIIPELVDIRNPDKMERMFKRNRPQVVFHAAAYKHVPMKERHPGEAIHNNVIGTKNTAELAGKYQVETFVNISTDKAVNPTSVMGASKRIAELIIKDINRTSKTKFAIVRFGNVLGSRGSVVPTFLKQIEKGGPVTITHPDMKRYFMTIPEAVQLVIQAGAMAKGGEIFLLDMGKQVKIDDLARDLIRLSGYEPDKDIEIVYTGIRPGEKLYEELFTDVEGLVSTKHERIFISNKKLDNNYLDISKSINLLVKNALMDRTEVLKMIIDLVPEYQGKYQVIAKDMQKANKDAG